jgi:hypothetical protein
MALMNEKVLAHPSGFSDALATARAIHAVPYAKMRNATCNTPVLFAIGGLFMIFGSRGLVIRVLSSPSRGRGFDAPFPLEGDGRRGGNFPAVLGVVVQDKKLGGWFIGDSAQSKQSFRICRGSARL